MNQSTGFYSRKMILFASSVRVSVSFVIYWANYSVSATEKLALHIGGGPESVILFMGAGSKVN
jgi:hypothetical protein